MTLTDLTRLRGWCSQVHSPIGKEDVHHALAEPSFPDFGVFDLCTGRTGFAILDLPEDD